MKKIFFIIPLIFLFCSKKKEINSLTIQYDKSVEINLFKGEYIVHFAGKADLVYHFKMYQSEFDRIEKSYQTQKISNYKKEFLIVDDKPLIMPATDIKYKIGFSDGSMQTLILRTDFRKNPLQKFKNLKVFLDEVNYILKTKKEIQNVEKSDLFNL